ncbi:hypothetical protein SKC35_06755 [Aquirufa sp. KTFRIE-69F]|uniref:Tail fiber protein n=1 Tax=Aquirufa originis TaxID=3096514 RepID=A0ABW6D593_9BACT
MKRLLLLFLLISESVYSQTGIGTSAPDASAKLEVNATNKGFLPPRVSLTNAYDQTTIPSPATGLLVYCKGDAGLSAGYYFWNGGAWATIATAGGSGSVAAEFGSQMLGVNPISITSSTPVELLSFTLPSAGTWEIIPVIRTQGSTTIVGQYALYDASGALISNSEILAGYGVLSTTGTAAYQVTTTGSATYKIKAWASNGAYNVYSNTDGRSFVTWKKISGNAPMTVINFGDIKTGIQTTDHNGWVKLDGRLKSSLTATQQSQATALGVGANLPDATDAVLVQSSGSLGSVTGSMSRMLAQNQLPNITPAITVNNTTATMQSAGSHQHPIAVVNSSVGGYAAYNPTAFKTGMAPTTDADADITDRGGTANLINTGIIGSAGDHTHIIDAHNHTATSTSINGGVTQQTIDITPRKLVVNTFIYLGF